MLLLLSLTLAVCRCDGTMLLHVNTHSVQVCYTHASPLRQTVRRAYDKDLCGSGAQRRARV